MVYMYGTERSPQVRVACYRFRYMNINYLPLLPHKFRCHTHVHEVIIFKKTQV